MKSNAASLLSYLLAFLTSIILGGYWLLYSSYPDAAILVLRPAVLGCAFLMALLAHKAPVTLAERRVTRVLALFCCALLVPCFTATDPMRALADWIKVVLVCAACLLWCRILRNEKVGQVFGYSLLVAAWIVAAFIAFTYIKHFGLALPTYKAIRDFKGFAAKEGVTLNPISFASVFSFAAAACLVRGRTFFLIQGMVLLFAATVLTGSRAPLAVLLGAGLLLALFSGLRSRRMPVRVFAGASLVVLTICAVALAVYLPSRQMSAITEGRWDLWSVAWQKFCERPVFGYGYDSWRDDLVSRLPGEYALTYELAKTIAGAYHNEYMTMLAEQGITGFLGALTVLVFLFRSSWRIAFYKWHTRNTGRWILFTSLFLMLRAALEVPGLFGYGQEPADYLAYFFLAIVVSRFSIEEDYLRLQAERAARTGIPAASACARPAPFTRPVLEIVPSL